MDAQGLERYLRQEIRREVFADRIELYLPFFFGNGDDAPLCLVWDQKGVLSDKGRTLAELKKRVGDLTPYRERIRRILAFFGTVTLEGGQNLVVRQFQTCISGERTYLDYVGGLNRLLRAMAQISAVDRIAVDEEGTVSVC